MKLKESVCWWWMGNDMLTSGGKSALSAVTHGNDEQYCPILTAAIGAMWSCLQRVIVAGGIRQSRQVGRRFTFSKILTSHGQCCPTAAVLSALGNLDGRFCRFAIHKIMIPLIITATCWMHGLGFAHVHETGSILQLAWMQPVATIIKGVDILRNVKW